MYQKLANAQGKRQCLHIYSSILFFIPTGVTMSDLLLLCIVLTINAKMYRLKLLKGDSVLPTAFFFLMANISPPVHSFLFLTSSYSS